MSDIFMILHSSDTLNIRGNEVFEATYTTDAVQASNAIQSKKRVFKLDSLKELKDIRFSYEEIPQELT